MKENQFSAKFYLIDDENPDQKIDITIMNDANTNHQEDGLSVTIDFGSDLQLNTSLTKEEALELADFIKFLYS